MTGVPSAVIYENVEVASGIPTLMQAYNLEDPAGGYMSPQMKRREFLKAGVLGALAFASSQKIFAEEKPQKFRVGMAATEWLDRDHSTDAYWHATEGISKLGIGATEADNGNAHLNSAYGKDPAGFVRKSREIGVRLEGVYQALLLHESNKLPEVLSKIRSDGSFLRAAHAEYIALGWDVPAPVNGKAYQRTLQDVRQTIRAADEIGRILLEEYGIFAAFHPERDIPKEMAIQILDGTNPKYVRFCADVGHLTGMGLDALQMVKKYSSRLAVSHWKDFDPGLPAPGYLGNDAKGDFVEVGQGIVNFHGLAEFYRQIGFNGWVMLELDQTRKGDIMTSAQAMKAYVTDQLKLRFYPPQYS
jgi:inosose dehydratase